MTTVAIHQPNYLPWLGYFAKIARAENFVFLGSVQFSKGGYTNRVRIALDGQPRWLTVPVSVRLGDPIDKVQISRAGWTSSHLSTIATAYADAPRYCDVRKDLEALFEGLESDGLAEANEQLIRRISARLDLSTRFLRDDELLPDKRGKGAAPPRADDRLIEICKAVGSAATYVSGSGGFAYQDPRRFAEAGIDLLALEYDHPVYTQRSDSFIPGLSIIDAIVNLGWDETRKLILARM